MKVEEVAIATIAFTLVGTLIQALIPKSEPPEPKVENPKEATVKPTKTETALAKKPSSLKELRQSLWRFAASHVRSLASFAIFLFVGFNVGLYITDVLARKRLPREDDDIPDRTPTCAKLVIQGHPECGRNLWKETAGTCEVPKEVFVFTTGDRVTDLQLYCAQLRVKYNSEQTRTGS